MFDRMKNWLEQLGDWPISRDRYWGTPLPIWLCAQCNEKVVIGSIDELKRKAKLKNDIDLHKPSIDAVIIPCKCGSTMKRVPEVLDVWFDSSVSSWAALGFPQNKQLFTRFWPADLNIEGTDQFRGWWNSQLISSVISFDQAPFKTIAVHGIVLAVSKKKMGLKEKMSKSLGNIVTPKEVIEKHNRDYLRSWVAATSKGEDMVFDWDYFKDINRFFNIFWNTFNFINLYLEAKPVEKITVKALKAEDKWLLSRVNSLTQEVTQGFENYNYPKVMTALTNFVLDDLSRTYIKLIRDRVGSESEAALMETLNYAVFKMLKLLAPLTPHIAEYIYQNLRTEESAESIHLNAFPEADKKMIDPALEEAMEQAKALTQTALSLREEHKLRLRWPLKSVAIEYKEAEKLKDLTAVLAKMCNVHDASVVDKEPKGKFASKKWKNLTVHLNLETDTALEEEWEFRELVRKVQSLRKEKKFNPKDIVSLHLSSSDPAFLEKFKEDIEKQTNSWIEEKKGKKEKLLNKSFFIEIKK
jgi:isoleucyl-tRNA synthetase